MKKLIENSEKLNDNLNPLSSEKYIEIQHKSKKNELICI